LKGKELKEIKIREILIRNEILRAIMRHDSCQFSGSGISLFCPLSLFARKGVASMPKSDADTSTEKSSLDEVAMSNDDLLS
jgi:hypothetical protein